MRENQDRANKIEGRYGGDDKARKAKATQRSTSGQIEQRQRGTKRQAEERRIFFDAEEENKAHHRQGETPQQKTD